MSNTTTYSSDGSKTTRPIKDAPYSIQAAWKHADSTGVAIIRVRSKRLRYEHTFGKTFRGTHSGRVSVYVPIETPKKAFLFKKNTNKLSWFKNLFKFNKSTMQIFEVPKEDVDLEEIYHTIQKAEKTIKVSNANNPFIKV
tara:strand:+ start:384 stop:803 length:420 start_codon:yes stop_codon:yes gene_type:complete